MANTYSVQVVKGFSVVQHIGDFGTIEEAESAAKKAAAFVHLGANEAVVIADGGTILREVKSGDGWPK